MATVQTSRHGTVTLKDNTGTPISATLGPGKGNFTADSLMDGRTDGSGYTFPTEVHSIMDRGVHQELVHGNEIPIKLGLEVYVDGLTTDATAKRPLDGAMKTGAFASGVTLDAGGDVWTTVWTLVKVRTVAGVSKTCTWIYNNVRTSVSHSEDITGDKFVFSGECYGGVKYSEA